jgi:hypothetical protein
MKFKISILLMSTLLLAVNSYSQDSIRTKNDKPGTPQSLRKPDNTPQTHVQVITNHTSPNQANVNRPSESNNVNNTSQKTITVDPNNTAGKPSPVNPTTITETPPDSMRTTTNSSAIQNGISNSSKPIRNQ